MLTISDKALEYIRQKGNSLYFEVPPRSTACCLSIQERPATRLGKPASEENYVRQEIQGVVCYIPLRFQKDRELTISLTTFLGRQSLSLDGWNLI